MLSPTAQLVLATVCLTLAALSRSAAANVVCPQMLANDELLPKFCAQNAYGQLDVSRSEFENWNCNHPFNSKWCCCCWW